MLLVAVQPDDVDADMVTDAALMLWNKCKTMLGRHQSPVVDFCKCLSRIDNVGKVGDAITSMKQSKVD